MQEIIIALQDVITDLFNVEAQVALTRPDEQFGDYATNVALQLSKQVGKNPREIAEAIAVKTRENSPQMIADISVAGPGFLNIHLTDEALLQAMTQAPTKSLVGKTIVAEYSDPNPFKVLHAGHLYTTIVGNAVANLLENAGAKVVRINFGGDVGLHVGKTMWAIRKELGGWDLAKIEHSLVALDNDLKAGWLSKRYIEGTNAYEDDEQAKAEIISINEAVYELYDKNDFSSDFGKIYKLCREWSYDYFKYFYEAINVTPFDRYLPESETAPVGLKVVKEQLAAGVYTESDGAVVFDAEKYGLHTRVFINSKGLPTYEAKDVGLLMVKWADYKFDQSVIITGNDIVEYMKVVLKSVEQFEPEPAKRTRHITHGQVKLAGGVKMSSRKGNILGALEVIEAAALASKKYAEESGNTYDVSRVHDAFKYAFLKNRVGGDVVYDPEESVAIEGNSGPYLQYAHARARSILTKAELTSVQLSNLQAGERTLVRKLTEYSDVVAKATDELVPHLVCTYLYELAQTFNRFYEQNRVIADPRQNERLVLVNKYADTLKDGLTLLGIQALERM